MFDPKKPNWVVWMTYWFNRATQQILLVLVGSWVVSLLMLMLRRIDSGTIYYVQMIMLSTVMMMYSITYLIAYTDRSNAGDGRNSSK